MVIGIIHKLPTANPGNKRITNCLVGLYGKTMPLYTFQQVLEHSSYRNTLAFLSSKSIGTGFGGL